MQLLMGKFIIIMLIINHTYPLFSYSRRIMWAQTAYSNNNPNIIAKYYLETVETIDGKYGLEVTSELNYILSGCPSIMRTDRGTENSIIAFLQPTLRHTHSDAFAREKSFQYGRSTANQV